MLQLLYPYYACINKANGWNKKRHPWSRAHWCGVDFYFKALGQTPAETARPRTWGQCVA